MRHCVALHDARPTPDESLKTSPGSPPATSIRRSASGLPPVT
jgi:hypothetical protein